MTAYDSAVQSRRECPRVSGSCLEDNRILYSIIICSRNRFHSCNALSWKVYSFSFAFLSTTLLGSSSGSSSLYIVATNMLALRRRKTTSNPDTNALGGSLRRTLTGTLRLSRQDRQIAVATPRRDETHAELEAAVSTISTTLSVLKDVTGALQNMPYVGAVAVAAVKVLEIREVMSSILIRLLVY